MYTCGTILLHLTWTAAHTLALAILDSDNEQSRHYDVFGTPGIQRRNGPRLVWTHEPEQPRHSCQSEGAASGPVLPFKDEGSYLGQDSGD